MHARSYDLLHFAFIGPTFWKSPSRKLFAVSKKSYKDNNFTGTAGQKRPVDVECNSGEEEEEEVHGRKIAKLAAKVDTVLGEMSMIRSVFDEAMVLTKDNQIPPGLRKGLRDTFKCRICLNTISPPLVVMKCCRILLGCEACVNNWFTGEDALTKQCPSCRIERGYTETMVLRGMDDFLRSLGNCELATDREQSPETI